MQQREGDKKNEGKEIIELKCGYYQKKTCARAETRTQVSAVLVSMTTTQCPHHLDDSSGYFQAVRVDRSPLSRFVMEREKVN